MVPRAWDGCPSQDAASFGQECLARFRMSALVDCEDPQWVVDRHGIEIGFANATVAHARDQAVGYYDVVAGIVLWVLEGPRRLRGERDPRALRVRGRIVSPLRKRRLP